MIYGRLPVHLGYFECHAQEMFFYQYLPIKLQGQSGPIVERRLDCFNKLIGKVCCDFIGEYGLNAFIDCYVYLTAKRLFVNPDCSFNRPGYHSDGFGTDDINYIWSDKFPTVFNSTKFDLSSDDSLSLLEMEQQAKKTNEVRFLDNSILRLNQFNIHKCGEILHTTIRTFAKLSFSGDKYDLQGNSHNYELDYNWEMKKRKPERNIPQSSKTVTPGGTFNLEEAKAGKPVICRNGRPATITDWNRPNKEFPQFTMWGFVNHVGKSWNERGENVPNQESPYDLFMSENNTPKPEHNIKPTTHELLNLLKACHE